MDSQKNINEIVKFFFTLQLLVKQYHWNTTSFSRHKATDQLLEKLADSIDKFVEVFIGRYNAKPLVTSLKLDASFISDIEIINLLQQSRTYLEGLNTMIDGSELLNIRDEMLADINQTLYLFQLK